MPPDAQAVSIRDLFTLVLAVFSALVSVIAWVSKSAGKLQLDALTKATAEVAKDLEKETHQREESSKAQGARIGACEGRIHALDIHASGVHERLEFLAPLPAKVDNLTDKVSKANSKLDMLLGTTHRSDQMPAVIPPRRPYPSKPGT